MTRADLSPGYQTVQAAHAVADWIGAHPSVAAVWAEVSNSLIVLVADDERALFELGQQAQAAGIAHTSFVEPDLCDELTAIAFSPGDATRKLCANLRLAGRRPPMPEAAAEILEREARLRDLARAMEGCEQTPGQDVLAHGRSVAAHYAALLDHLAGRLDLHAAPNWRLPAWVDQYRDELLAAAPPAFVMRKYLVLHDAGKPEVLQVDAAGRRHFPGHAAASQATYRRAYGAAADERVADLIAHNMDVHLLKAVGVEEFCGNPNAVGHLLAGLAEVHSNAQMFGGVDSVGFKIKAKHLTARGKAICATLFGPRA